MMQGTLRVFLSLGRGGVEMQGWGSVTGQPALAFASAGCERAVLGLSPASHPPVCFPQQGQSVS